MSTALSRECYTFHAFRIKLFHKFKLEKRVKITHNLFKNSLFYIVVIWRFLLVEFCFGFYFYAVFCICVSC